MHSFVLALSQNVCQNEMKIKYHLCYLILSTCCNTSRVIITHCVVCNQICKCPICWSHCTLSYGSGRYIVVVVVNVCIIKPSQVVLRFPYTFSSYRQHSFTSRVFSCWWHGVCTAQVRVCNLSTLPLTLILGLPGYLGTFWFLFAFIECWFWVHSFILCS